MAGIEILATVLCCIAVASYGGAGALFLLKKAQPGAVLTAVGWVANLGIFIKNWYINGYPPFASMYQVLADLSLVFPILLVVIVFAEKGKRWLAPYFCIGAAIPLLGTLFMDRQMRWSLVPALQSPWFVPHVFSYMLSYALCAVAFIVSIASLIKKDRLPGAQDSVYTILRIAFPFMTLGLLLGAVWADQVWGNYWSWDLKEVWALITCMFYLCYFHARRVKSLQKYNYLFTTLGFAALIITFVCVNWLPKQPGSLHTYT